MLKNLAEIIVERRDQLKSLEFNLICTLVRKLKSNSTNEPVTLTVAEVNFFNTNSKQ